jgi:hypothetical protein
MQGKLEAGALGLLLIAVSSGLLGMSSPARRVEKDSTVEGKAAIILPDRKCQGVPATGQTHCFDLNGDQFTCGGGTGQDGESQNGWTLGPYPRFTDRGNGTVKDNLTGLIWLKDADCFGLRDWPGALEDANTVANGSCGLADGSVAGDWRMPNVRELQSLIDYGQFDPALQPGHPFAGVQSLGYWSSTSFQGVPSLAWTVGFQGGQLGLDEKGPFQDLYIHYVWPVRDGH